MYAGAVPAIAELIANSWDADSKIVRIAVPLGEQWNPDSEITVEDDGVGMTFDDCNDAFLVLGRNRREQGERSAGNRLLIGHKGIGKLAGFGVANVVEVRTVKDGELTHFQMDYDKIENQKFGAQYHPHLIENAKTKEKNGTTVTLRQIKLVRALNAEQFMEGMARRFAIFSDEFRVFVNGALMKKSTAPLEFKFPTKQDGLAIKSGWGVEDIPNAGQIKWWIGFTKDTIKEEESRGVSVLVRGKLAQTPWFFGLSGGVYGQHGMQYTIGEVIADFLDEDEDYVATDRASILWDTPLAKPLQEWGREKIKDLLKKRNDLKFEATHKEVATSIPYKQVIKSMPESYRQQVVSVVERVCSIPEIPKKDASDISLFVINAFLNKHTIALIKQINELPPDKVDDVLKTIADWDIVEAVNLAQLVRGRIEIINQFEQMIGKGVREKPDMQDFLKAHPWIMDPSWDVLSHESSLDKLISSHFHSAKSGTKEGRTRIDFFCLASQREAVIVEVKRPGIEVGTKEMDQLRDYVLFLRKQAQTTTDPRYKLSQIEGILIASKVDDEASELKTMLENNRIFVRDWHALLRITTHLHREFLEVVKNRAPKDNPLMKEIAKEIAVRPK